MIHRAKIRIKRLINKILKNKIKNKLQEIKQRIQIKECKSIFLIDSWKVFRFLNNQLNKMIDIITNNKYLPINPSKIELTQLLKIL